MKIKLTKTQKEILLHRLELEDCLVEVLCDGWEDSNDVYHPDDVEAVISALWKGFAGTTLDCTEAMELSEGITKDVLADCIEGGTWVASASGEDTIVIASATRSARSLAKKISEAIGRELEYPEY